MKIHLLLLCLGVSLWACNSAPTETGSEGPDDEIANVHLPALPVVSEGIHLPAGFEATLVADGLGRARHLTVRDNGDIYVKMGRVKPEDGEKGIWALRDADGDGTYEQQEGFGDYAGTGIAIFENYLYASSDREVYRYALQEGQLLPDPTPETVVTGFVEQGQHASKPLAFDEEGYMYVTVGAPSNACQETMRTPGSPGLDPCPQLELQAGIWRFQAAQLGQTQVDDGLRYASGIRNAVAIDWNVQTGSLFAMQHGRDDLHRLFPDLYTQAENTVLPAEELLQIDEGDDFGWPYCYYDQLEGMRKLGPEYGGDSEQQGRCADIKEPTLAFPGHLGPNDLLFYTGTSFPKNYQNGAFVAFHGSWNRAPDPQAGYFVAFVPMTEGFPSGDWVVFANGFDQQEVDFTSPGDATYRPCGLAQGPDGSLFVADSRQGRIWRIAYTGAGEGVASK